MAAVVAVGKGQVHALVEAHLHSPAHQGFDGFFVIVDGILHILDLSSVGELPEPVFQILLLNGGDILGHMAVEAVAYVLPVGHILHDPVFFPELLYLEAAQVLRRCGIDGVQVSVGLLEFVDLVVDVLEHLQGKLAVLHQGLAVVKLLELIKGCDPEGCGGCFKERLDLIVEAQVAAVKAALAVSQRIGGGPHLAQICVGADMDLPDQLQIVVQDLVEIAALLAGLCQDHGQVQAYDADVEAAHEYRRILFVRRLHSTSFVPGGQEGAAAHGADDLSIFLIHAGNIALSCQGQPVWIHGPGGALDPRLKHILQLLSGAVEVFIIKEYQLREKDRLFMVFLSLSLSSDVQHGNSGHFGEPAGPGPCGHSDKGVIPAAGGNGIKLVLPALEALLHVPLDVVPGHFLCFLLRNAQVRIFFYIFFI